MVMILMGKDKGSLYRNGKNEIRAQRRRKMVLLSLPQNKPLFFRREQVEPEVAIVDVNFQDILAPNKVLRPIQFLISLYNIVTNEL
jgi:hypothetical protein